MRLRSALRNSMWSLPDSRRRSLTAAAPFSASLPTTMTMTPSMASTRAIALPIPSVPPVTSAVRPWPDGSPIRPGLLSGRCDTIDDREIHLGPGHKIEVVPVDIQHDGSDDFGNLAVGKTCFHEGIQVR